jgi:hypothetical protein
MRRGNIIFSDHFSEQRDSVSDKVRRQSGLKYQPTCQGITKQERKCNGAASSNGYCRHHNGISKRKSNQNFAIEPQLSAMLVGMEQQQKKLAESILSAPLPWEAATQDLSLSQKEERETQRRILEQLDVRDMIVHSFAIHDLLLTEVVKIALNPKTPTHHKNSAIRLISELELNKLKILKMTGFLKYKDYGTVITTEAATKNVDCTAMYEGILEHIATTDRIKDEALRKRTMSELEASFHMAQAAVNNKS